MELKEDLIVIEPEQNLSSPNGMPQPVDEKEAESEVSLPEPMLSLVKEVVEEDPFEMTPEIEESINETGEEYFRHILKIKGPFMEGYELLWDSTSTYIFEHVKRIWKRLDTLTPDEKEALFQKIRYEIRLASNALLSIDEMTATYGGRAVNIHLRSAEYVDVEGSIKNAFLKVEYIDREKVLRRTSEGDYITLDHDTSLHDMYGIWVPEGLLQSLRVHGERGVMMMAHYLFEQAQYIDKGVLVQRGIYAQTEFGDNYENVADIDTEFGKVLHQVVKFGSRTFYQTEDEFAELDTFLKDVLDPVILSKVFDETIRERYADPGKLGWSDEKIDTHKRHLIETLTGSTSLEIVRGTRRLFPFHPSSMEEYLDVYGHVRRGNRAFITDSYFEAAEPEPLFHDILDPIVEKRKSYPDDSIEFAVSILKPSLEKAVAAFHEDAKKLALTRSVFKIMIGVTGEMNPAQATLFAFCRKQLFLYLRENEFAVTKELIIDLEERIRQFAHEQHFNEEPGKRYSLSTFIYRYVYKGQMFQMFPDGVIAMPEKEDFPVFPEEVSLSAKTESIDQAIIYKYDLTPLSDFIESVRTDTELLTKIFDRYMIDRYKKQLGWTKDATKKLRASLLSYIDDVAICLIRDYGTICAGDVPIHPGSPNEKLQYPRITVGEHFLRMLASGKRPEALNYVNSKMTNREFFALTLLEESQHFLGENLPHITYRGFTNDVITDLHDPLVPPKNQFEKVTHNPGWLHALVSMQVDIDCVVKALTQFKAPRKNHTLVSSKLKKGNDAVLPEKIISGVSEEYSISSRRKEWREPIPRKIALDIMAYRIYRDIIQLHSFRKTTMLMELRGGGGDVHRYIRAVLENYDGEVSEDYKEKIRKVIIDSLQKDLERGGGDDSPQNTYMFLKNIVPGNKVLRHYIWKNKIDWVTPDVTEERGYGIWLAEGVIYALMQEGAKGRKYLAFLMLEEAQHFDKVTFRGHAFLEKFSNGSDNFDKNIEHSPELRYITNIIRDTLAGSRDVMYASTREEYREMFEFVDDVRTDTNLMHRAFDEFMRSRFEATLRILTTGDKKKELKGLAWDRAKTNAHRDLLIDKLQNRKLAIDMLVGEVELVLQKPDINVVNASARTNETYVYPEDLFVVFPEKDDLLTQSIFTGGHNASPENEVEVIDISDEVKEGLGTILEQAFDVVHAAFFGSVYSRESVAEREAFEHIAYENITSTLHELAEGVKSLSLTVLTL